MESFLFTKIKKLYLAKKGFSYFSVLISILLLNIVILIISLSFKTLLSTSIPITDAIEAINYPVFKTLDSRHFNRGMNEGVIESEQVLFNQIITIKKLRYKRKTYYFVEPNHLRMPAISNKGK